MATLHSLKTSDHVLIVEDDSFIASDIEEDLLELGFDHIDVALNFDDAELALAEQKPDLVIFDINVGGKLSFGLIAKAREQGAAVVSTSGYLAVQEGLSGTVFAPKPVSAGQLKAAVARAQSQVRSLA